MLRLFGLGLVVAALLVTIATAPVARGLDHGEGEAGTPAASPGAMAAVMGGTGAAYLRIVNAGAEPDRLLGGETAVAAAAEVHQIAAAGDVMQMRPLADGLEIPAGGEVTLEPGGYHLMLVNLAEDLTLGKTFDLTLRFERAGEVVVPVAVRPRAEPRDGQAAPLVVAGDLTIENAWSRPAPALAGLGTGAAATPAATPAT